MNTCATTAITGFLVNGTMPDEGTTCAADPQPAASEPQPATGEPQPATGEPQPATGGAKG